MQSADERFTRRAARVLSPRHITPIVKQLAQERKIAGLKLGEVADRAGYSESHFEKLEAGHRLPHLPTLNAWAEVLGWELVLKKRSET